MVVYSSQTNLTINKKEFSLETVGVLKKPVVWTKFEAKMTSFERDVEHGPRLKLLLWDTYA